LKSTFIIVSHTRYISYCIFSVPWCELQIQKVIFDFLQYYCWSQMMTMLNARGEDMRNCVLFQILNGHFSLFPNLAINSDK